MSSPLNDTLLNQPLKVGLVGTGYAAQLRAEALRADVRSHPFLVAGHRPEKTLEFSRSHGLTVADSWQAVVHHPDVDLVCVAHLNRDHAPVVAAALQAHKHVIVEYPLAFSPQQGQQLLALARAQQRLLHVEHIELLGGLHQAMQQHLPAIGAPSYVRYSTLKPQRPAPTKWTYRPAEFGFPLVGALSRIHRLTHLFGPITAVTCQLQYDGVISRTTPEAFTSCLCIGQFQFQSGLLAEVSYGKGELIWQVTRRMEIYGQTGALVFEADHGTLIRPEDTQPIVVGSRRGLFKRDTQMVLDHLSSGTPLYVTPQQSLLSLAVADAARRSAETGEMVRL
ncbi:putative oxidoreductase YdgJ [Halomicronema hongdechloris C2206]|uniref:Oxidoreductase YdgJ n=1 Tax=Halomicronema hongdechloris C2206 TaxID=1641165 RepID=A0A1Z3HKF3_9CYAN|nr:Gfo/Idh/MocA family oxidoreductase [Halomicronema hongdechloris]ASC70773.1 putative oxidoreductase YdgJ [Halomicronema hongdechloris C2206]